MDRLEERDPGKRFFQQRNPAFDGFAPGKSRIAFHTSVASLVATRTQADFGGDSDPSSLSCEGAPLSHPPGSWARLRKHRGPIRCSRPGALPAPAIGAFLSNEFASPCLLTTPPFVDSVHDGSVRNRLTPAAYGSDSEKSAEARRWYSVFAGLGAGVGRDRRLART